MASPPSFRQIHWRSPTIILAAFFAALAFAIGHHGFYMHLDNQAVDTDNRLFSQQVNIAIGSAFALLFRAALVISLATVYWQVFWTALLRQRKPVAVSHIDALAGALTSLFDLLDLQALLRHKTLVALAFLSWLLPLAAVLPPATLSVEVTRHIEDVQQEVPTLDFSNPALVYTTSTLRREDDAETMVGGVGPDMINITGGASSDLFDLLRMVATNHEIPDFPGIGTNKSHQLEFSGSTLRCKNIVDEDLDFFRAELMCKGTPTTCNNLGAQADVNIYSSWIPQHRSATWKPDGPEELSELEAELTPTQNATRDFSTRWIKGSGIPQRPSDIFGSPYLLIATKSAQPSPDDNGTTIGDWHVLNCSLHYATYTGTVLSSDDRSIVSEYTVEAHDDIVPPATSNLQASKSFSSPDPSDFGQLALLSCLDFILRGDLDAALINAGTAPQSDRRPISGSSGILGTNLMYSSELLLENEVHLGHTAYPYNVTEHYWNASAFDDVVVAASTFNRSLASGVEELYHNMTLSLLSRKRFQADHGRQATVTVELWRNTYVYRSRNLLISYGLALLLSLATCTLGCFTIYHNGGSYTNRFSTILRVARGHDLTDFDSLLTDEDRKGADPLSQHVASARLALGRDVDEDGVDHCESGAELQHMIKTVVEQDVAMDQNQSKTGSRGADALPVPSKDADSELSRESRESLQRPPGTSDEAGIEDECRRRGR